ncbi:MAG TPA: DNA polymerase Y family protein [Magnetospirillaceae bacterium]|jgi:protein ImuB
METAKRIVSLWLPDFGTDRLTRRNPDQCDRPLATIIKHHGALAVAATNEAAREAGVHHGQALADARSLCPAIKTVGADPAAEMETLTQIARWCTQWSPWTSVESLSVDGRAGLWIDATGCAHLFGGEQAMLDNMIARLAAVGFTARAAIADSPAAAWAMAHFGIDEDKTTAIVPEGAARQWLAGLPVMALRLPPPMIETLRRLGLRRIGDLAALPRAPLAARFGSHLPQRLDQLIGEAPEPICPDRPVIPYQARMAFPEPIATTEGVKLALTRLIEPLCRALERDRKGARRLDLTLYRVDGTLAEITVGTAAPTRAPKHLNRLFAEKLGEIDAGFGIEAIVLVIPIVDPLAAYQIDLPEERLSSGMAGAELTQLVDRLSQRLGSDSVIRQAPRGSHIPERAIQGAAPLGRLPAGTTDPRARPVTLMRRPEPVQTVSPPDVTPEAPPTAFRWRGETHRVARAEGPERIVAEWWHAATPPPPTAFRDYWRIEDAQGLRWWLFRDGAGGRWFLHGMLA